jgi:hypothetical protein
MNSNYRSGIIIFSLSILLAFSGCKYRKGDSFNYSGDADSLSYIIATRGSGRHIIKKVSQLKINHERKEDECHIFYISDSANIIKNKSVLLFNSVLPDLKNDLLSKGFMGAFGTKQIITYLVVTKNDFNRYFTPVKKHKEHPI